MKINKTAKELRLGQMVPNMRAITKTAKKMVNNNLLNLNFRLWSVFVERWIIIPRPFCKQQYRGTWNL